MENLENFFAGLNEISKIAAGAAMKVKPYPMQSATIVETPRHIFIKPLLKHWAIDEIVLSTEKAEGEIWSRDTVYALNICEYLTIKQNFLGV